MKKKLEIITLISTMLTICISSYASAEDAASKKFRNAVEDILFSMDKSPEGKKALESASRILKIERLTDDDHLSLRYVKDLMRFID